MRNNVSGRHHTKPFLRSGQAEARHAFAQDHRARRAACVDRAPFPGTLCGLPGAAILHGLVQVTRITAWEIDQIGVFKDRFPLGVISRVAVDNTYRAHLCTQILKMPGAHAQPAIDATISFPPRCRGQTGHARFASIEIQAVQQITVHLFHHRQILPRANQIN